MRSDLIRDLVYVLCVVVASVGGAMAIAISGNGQHSKDEDDGPVTVIVIYDMQDRCSFGDFEAPSPMEIKR